MAVHTVLSSTEIKKILSNYQIGDLKDYVGIKEGIENTNYPTAPWGFQKGNSKEP